MTQRTALSGQVSTTATRGRRLDAAPSGSGPNTSILRPVADLSAVGTDGTLWTPAPAGATVWDKIDDPTLQPDVSSPGIDDYAYCNAAGPVAFVGKFASLSLARGESVTAVTLWVQYAAGNTTGTTSFTAALLKGSDGSALATTTADTAATTTIRWASATYSGTLSASQLEQLRFSLTTSNTFNGSRVYNVYAVVTTTGPTGGVFDNGAHVYSDANPPVSLNQTAVIPADHPQSPASGLGVQYVGDDGIFRGKTSTGVVHQMIPATDKAKLDASVLATPAPLVTPPPAITTTEAIAYSFAVPANFFQVGSTYRLFVFGVITATASPTVLARLRIGTAGTTADTQVAATAAAAATTGTGFSIEATFTVRTIGSGGTVIGNLLVAATAPIKSAQTATVALNTTVANTVSVTAIGGGTVPSISIVQAYAQPVR